MEEEKINNGNGSTNNNNKAKARPPCQFCKKPSKNVYFAAFVCDSEACIDKAMAARGGPAGHKKDPKKWMKENK